ncbi:hypothetical protein BCS37_02185 [Selenomonas sp. oral taxon 920]|uniref:glycosyltransferase family 2 protein n=1 Tax=Selenomonas sp. oral taxon 920 TaxID=1884263 RepID=UPI0008409B38|nr:glycosyltransferase family 2 protein [Selenomonas sp. oral taxon 920]AOH47322.1 hypothetical protein BCS37_02185 [Selenomonas sp. oral taxon 920]
MNITVITSVYNGEDTIKKTIESVLAQKVKPYEYLIVDGLSSDHTVEIAESYREAFENRGIIYNIVSEKDSGIYDAFNKGVRLAKGEYIAFLNADDWYTPTALKTVQETYAKTPFDFAYGTIQYMGTKGAILKKKSRLDSFVSSRNWNHPSSFVKKNLYLDAPFDLQFKAYADFDWFLKVRKRPIKIVIFPENEVIAHFQAGGTSINADFSKMMQRASEKAYAYRRNGYSRIYFFEAYGWEFVKYLFSVIFT